jgi:large subunit ribosomal protein L14e
VLLKSGPSAGHIAVIAEIIDHNRVRGPCETLILSSALTARRLQAIVDGPTTGVPRQAFPYKHMTLTPLTLTKLPRAAGSGLIKKQLESEGTVAKWEQSAWAQKRAAIERRRLLNDFGRFTVMLAKKVRRDGVRKSLAKAKKA